MNVAQGYIAEAKPDVDNTVVETNEADNNALMSSVVPPSGPSFRATFTNDAANLPLARRRSVVGPCLKWMGRRSYVPTSEDSAVKRRLYRSLAQFGNRWIADDELHCPLLGER